MPQRTPLKAGESSRVEIASMMLSFVSWVGDSAVLLPGLKLVAQAGIQILQVVQTMQSNKAEALNIAERAYQLIGAMMDSLKDKNEGDVDPSLVDDLRRFYEDLERILQILESISSKPKFMEKIYRHRMHSDELVRCKERLDQSFMRFTVHNSIAMRLQLYANTRSQEAQREVNSIQLTVVNQVPPKNPPNDGGIPSVDPSSLLTAAAAADGTASLADDVAAMSIRNGESSVNPSLSCSDYTFSSIRQPDPAPLRSPPVPTFSKSFIVAQDCGYCTYETATVRLWPCGHVMCDDCSTVSVCPTCMKPVKTQRQIEGLTST